MASFLKEAVKALSPAETTPSILEGTFQTRGLQQGIYKFEFNPKDDPVARSRYDIIVRDIGKLYIREDRKGHPRYTDDREFSLKIEYKELGTQYRIFWFSGFDGSEEGTMQIQDKEGSDTTGGGREFKVINTTEGWAVVQNNESTELDSDERQLLVFKFQRGLIKASNWLESAKEAAATLPAG